MFSLLSERRFQFFGIGRKNGGVFHFAGVRFQRQSLEARNYVVVQVKYRLSTCGLVILNDADAVGIESRFGSDGDFLHQRRKIGEHAWIGIEQVARRSLRQNECVPG